MHVPHTSEIDVGIRTLVRIRLHDLALESKLRHLAQQTEGHTGPLDGATIDVTFGLASCAVTFGRQVAEALGRSVRIGIASGEKRKDDGRLSSLASIALGAADPGQVVLCLATVEICRRSSKDTERFVDLGVMRADDRSERVRLFLLDASGVVVGSEPKRFSPDECFIGRQKEIGQLKRMLDLSKLVTVVGPVGSGKSSLIRRLGIEVDSDFEDGVVLVDLSEVEDERQVVPIFCQALEVPRQDFERALDAVSASIASRRLLLILDGCERWTTLLNQIVPTLLDRCEHLQVLCSGLRRLRHPSEAVFRIGGLDTPGAEVDPAFFSEFDSVGLFLERAEQVDPTFRLDEDRVKWVTAICRRLDGNPLAIRMAASKVAVLSPRQIHDRLEHRFAFLKFPDGGKCPRRHSSLRSMVDWSLARLSKPAVVLLRRLSILEGAYSVEVAAAICEDGSLPEEAVMESFEELIECSFLQPSAIQGDERRFFLSETVRLFAKEFLLEGEERERLEERKLEWAERLAEEATIGLTGPEQSRWLLRIDAGYADLREAVQRLLRVNEPERAAKVAHACWSLWYQRGFHEEGIGIFTDILRHPKMKRSALRPRFLNVLATLQMADARFDEARLSATRSLCAARAMKDRFVEACASSTVGIYWVKKDRPNRAKLLFRRVAATFRELRDDARLLSTLGNLLACYEGPVTEEERAVGAEAVEVCSRCQNLWYESSLLNNLAEREWESGDCRRALPLAARALKNALTLEDEVNSLRLTRTLVKVLSALDRVEDAIRWCGFGKMLAAEIVDPMSAAEDHLELVLTKYSSVISGEGRSWYEEGRSWNRNEAIENVISTL